MHLTAYILFYTLYNVYFLYIVLNFWLYMHLTAHTKGNSYKAK